MSNILIARAIRQEALFLKKIDLLYINEEHAKEIVELLYSFKLFNSCWYFIGNYISLIDHSVIENRKILQG